MFAAKEETLGDILDVFSKTKVKLSTFLDKKSEEKVDLEASLNSVNADIEKGTKVLDNVNDFLGEV